MIENFAKKIHEMIQINDFKNLYKLLEQEIYTIIYNEAKKENQNYNCGNMYQLVDFANNNFGKEKSRIVNYYYMITQNNNNLEDSVNNLMEIYYLVKKW